MTETSPFQNILAANKMIAESRAKLEMEVNEGFAKLQETVRSIRQVFPDYKPPFKSNEAEEYFANVRGPKSELAQAFVRDFFAWLPTDVKNRVQRKAIIAKFEETYGAERIDNRLNNLFKDGTVVDGFKLEKLRIPEDKGISYIKIPA